MGQVKAVGPAVVNFATVMAPVRVNGAMVLDQARVDLSITMVMVSVTTIQTMLRAARLPSNKKACLFSPFRRGKVF
jgi:hypothetical protein